MRYLKSAPCILIIFLFVFTLVIGIYGKEPVDYVDPFLGTSRSRWMLYPGPSMPFGMVKLSPDNQGQSWNAGYEYKIDRVTGFSHIHSHTMGGLLVTATTGEMYGRWGWNGYYGSQIIHKRETASPGYYAVTLEDYDIRAELTSTTRCGFLKFTFPEAENATILFDLKIPTECGFTIHEAYIRKVNDTEIEGYSVQQTGRGRSWNEYTLHFVARFSKPFKSFTGWKSHPELTSEWNHERVYRDVNEIHGKGDVGVFLDYSTNEGEVIMVKTGVSFVSMKQARLNLETEIAAFGWDFDAARNNARNAWNELIGKIEVYGGAEADKIKFYTNMYRSYCSRTIFSDVNGKYVDMYEKVQQIEDPDSPVYGCDALWMTFWNQNQLWTLLTPDIANKWVKSLLEIYDVGGWLPKGPSGIEYGSIMVASHEVPLIVSAYQKGIRKYDIEKAYKAIKHVMTEPGRAHEGGGAVGNHNLKSYLELGYVPHDEGPVSNTLEYAYDDWCVAQMSKSLGNKEDYKDFIQRANYYRNVFDTSTGYVRPKYRDGRWLENFDPYYRSTGGYASGFVEGNSWQYTWFVPHDVKGLINLMGREEFIQRLDEGFEKARSEHFHYRFGTINHGNQPNMHVAYLFNYVGAPWLTQKWVRELMEHYYGLGPVDGYPGDEDQGQMAAWYVMSSIGLFELRGGAAVRPVYEIGSPIFDKVVIHLDKEYYNGGEFVIEARNNSKQNVYIQSATLNGKKLNRPWFYHDKLVKGGRLVLEMGPTPNKKWGSSRTAAPPSMSD